MKNLCYALLLLCFCPLTSQAQDLYQTQQKVLQTALSYGDGQAAKSALFNMMALKPENKALKDTLALLYFRLGNYSQAEQVLNQVMEDKPENAQMLEMLAVSQQQQGKYKTALRNYEKLYRQTQEVLYLYEIGTMQYQLKRLGECKMTTDAILSDTSISGKRVSIRAGKGSQQVPLKAATYNLRGVMAMDLKEYEAALQSFNKALELEPKFVLAMNNKNALTKKLKKNKKTGAGQTGAGGQN